MLFSILGLYIGHVFGSRFTFKAGIFGGAAAENSSGNKKNVHRPVQKSGKKKAAGQISSGKNLSPHPEIPLRENIM